MLPVSSIALPCGLLTCLALEATGAFGHGAEMPAHAREVLTRYADEQMRRIKGPEAAELIV